MTPFQLDFFEVSGISFVDGLGKWKEGFVRKRVGDDVSRGLSRYLSYFRCGCCR